MYELNLNDLRRLAKLGNATVKLDDNRIGELHAMTKKSLEGVYVKNEHANAIIDGKKYSKVTTYVGFARALPRIKNIRIGENGPEVARRVGNKLVSTDIYLDFVKKAPSGE